VLIAVRPFLIRKFLTDDPQPKRFFHKITKLRDTRKIFRTVAKGKFTRYRIFVEGVVQGVGLRPFVKRLADGFGLCGVTSNNSGGLIIELDSRDAAIFHLFTEALRKEAPAAAHIERFTIESLPAGSPYSDFRIVASAERDRTFTLISPDLGTCPDCFREIRSPSDPRYRYAFTNCTNCGPRYSIMFSTPYDRANTTMRGFPLCPACAAEYADVSNRRFHAEPVACPQCGPQLSLGLLDAIATLQHGQILGIKGLGGYQLVCNAFDPDAVNRLRIRKRRSRKPFAVMMRDMNVVERHCALTNADRKLLASSPGPIVLLEMCDSAAFAPGVTPGLSQIGVMLPYTPLHNLLFEDSLECLVVTSGNISEEPIVATNQEALLKLSPLCDRLLMHDRDIFMRVDDSVARNFEGIPRVLRRARGYAPSAIVLARNLPEVLATGAELKNTFCITKGAYAIPSQHIGDLENYETLNFFEESLHNLQSLYQSQPKLIVHDLHPDYLSTRWAMGRPEPKMPVQHHHAHIASCMAENHLSEPVIGVAFDGTGWGTDGQVWGGEFLLCDYTGFERAAHLRYVALPGGDRAARQGWRMAAAHLYDAFGSEFGKLPLPCRRAVSDRSWKLIHRLLEHPSIRTSSCGRLFDAVAAICGIAQESTYEGETAMLLEAAAALYSSDESYLFESDRQASPWVIDTRPVLRQIANEIVAGRPAHHIARCFHNSIALMIESVCGELRERSGVDKVCLSGGVFQNFTLLTGAVSSLRRSGFQVYLHSQVPPNDGGISLGQAVIGATFLERS
jgi:hydrogenase maturation protein HypF